MIQGMKSDNHNFGTVSVTESELAQLKTLIRQAKDLWHSGSPTELGRKLLYIEAFIVGLGTNVPRTRMDQ